MRHTYHKDEVNGFSFSLIHNTILNIVFGVAFSVILSVVLGIAVYPSHVSAYGSTSTTVTKNASVTVSAACSFSSGGGEYSRTLNSGSNAEITANNITTSCNDLNGYAVYAIGYSGDSYDSATHTDMIASLGSSYNIKTDGSGTYGSRWQMKITPVTNAAAMNNFNTYQNIPSTFTKVAQYTANTNNGTITPSYQINVASSQPAGTYEGKVKYVLVHPNDAAAPSTRLYFQDATSADCGKTMYDNRGTDAYKNVAYTTATINGLCWMTRNLDLPGGTTLTPSDSNITSNYTLPASSTSGFDDNTKAFVYNSDSTNFNDTSCGDGDPCYSYYSWVAATAGTSPSSGNASSDICPKGWRLPTQAEFNTLIDTYTTGAALTASPFLGVYAGLYLDSSFDYGGWYGLYWPSTAYSSNGAYGLNFGSSSAGVSSYSKSLGNSIRCVMKDTRTIADMEYMQDVNADIVSNTAEGATMTLKDKRDEQSYTVAKINGALWMTRNLAIGCNGSGSTYGSSVSSKSLTSTYSNVSTTWSTPTALLSAASSSTQTADYTNPRMQCSSTAGAWYNYAAATAGTITGSSNSTVATKDICPAGWHLPTGPNTTSGTDINKLVGNTTSGWQAATTGLTAFGAVAGGYYVYGSLYNTEFGGWWSAAADGTAYRYYLYYNSSAGQFSGSDISNRYYGSFVRCVRSS